MIKWSGTGNLCGELSDKIHIVGIDTNLEMISYAKEKYNNMEVKVGSFLEKPFRKNYFDVVVTKGRQDLLDVINRKYYTNLDELEEFVRSLNCKIHSEHIVNFTWIIEIEKQGATL